METVEVVPLEGIQIKGERIALGATREAVERVLGAPENAWDDSTYYFASNMRFDFDGDGRIESIEFLAGIDGDVQPRLYGVYAFQASADELFTLLKEKNGDAGIDDSEGDYGPAFLGISVGLYRETLPSERLEYIESAAAEGSPLSPEEVAYEMRRAAHWDTLCLGVEGYYCS